MAEIQQRISQLSDENKHLVNTLTQLRKQVARLESLKKAVLSTLQEETSQGLDDPNENLYAKFELSNHVLFFYRLRRRLSSNNVGPLDILFYFSFLKKQLHAGRFFQDRHSLHTLRPPGPACSRAYSWYDFFVL